MPAKSVKFLLVDDLDANLLALEGLLRRDGLELLMARSGKEALEILLVQDIALAFLDVQMPEMNGFELAELMRGTERTRRVPIIFITAGATDQERRFRGYETGAVDFLIKPVEPHVLHSKANVFYDLARQRCNLETIAEEKAQLANSLGAAQAKLQSHADALDQRVRERTASLEETNKNLEAFCYTIAHDLRGPLRAQNGFAQMLIEDYGDALGDVGRDLAGRIQNNALRLENLIDDLLSYSRISREEIPLSSLNLHDAAAKVCGDLGYLVEETSAKIDLPAFDFRVSANETMLSLALTNLVSNALKFRKPETAPEVRITAERRGDQIRLWVIDSGIGIASQYFEKIFVVFHRLHKVGKYPGTGIGLAIVKKAIERMGGRVGIESEEGAGSRFWIELKAAE